MFAPHRGGMPIVARQGRHDASTASVTVPAVPIDGARPSAVLLPSDDPTGREPAMAPHRTLALDAIEITRMLRDRPRDAGPWGEPAFAREVDLIRSQLAPIRTRPG